VWVELELELHVKLLFQDLRPLIWRICGHLSGRFAATYLEDLRPLIYLVNCENKAKLSPAEAGAWAELGNNIPNNNDCSGICSMPTLPASNSHTNAMTKPGKITP
jgi:hypothetical protein